MPGSLRGLRRIPSRGVIGGVLAGIAEYFDWNVRLLRAAVVIVFIFSGFFPIVLAYCVLWYVMDPAPAGTSGPAYATDYPPSSPDGPAPRPASREELRARFVRLEERLGRMEDCVTSREFELRQELKKLESGA